MSGGLRIASIRGVPITIHSTALLLAGVYAWLWAGAFPPEEVGVATTVAVGVVAVVGVSVSILLHELGHVVAGHAVGIRAIDISLWGLGGMARFESRPRSGGAEVLLSAAGPAVSLALSGLFYIGAWMTEPAFAASRAAVVTWYMLSQLAWWNLFIGLLNLAPGPPLDGGGVVRGFAWAIAKDEGRAIRISAITGLVTAGAAVVAAITPLGEQVLPGSRLMLLFVAFLLGMGAYPILQKGSRPGAPHATDERTRLLQDAARLAQERGDPTVGSLHLLMALSRCGIEPLASFLYRHGITADRLNGAAPPAAPPEGRQHARPMLSDGARQILEGAPRRGPGVLGVFLALPEESQASSALSKIGVQLPALKAELVQSA